MKRLFWILLLSAAACQRNASEGGGSAQPSTVNLTGAGSTFVYPLFSKWFAEYNRLHPEVRANYQSIGSGAGIKQITEKTVDFGATDGPMTAEELAKAPGILHIPVTSGAAVLAYRLKGVDSLKLTPETVAAIFLGKIAKWSDPALAKDNPGVSLPDTAIAVAHRSDGSGTTAIFTDYLAKVSPEWKTSVGAGKSVKWPVGLGGKGNEGVSGILQQTEGAIGYVELAYAKQNKMQVASLRNRDGAFVMPTLEGISAASAQAEIPDDFRVSITDAPGKETWPIAGFTWVLLYREQPDAAKGEALVKLLSWGVHDGQTIAPSLDYAPLPASLVARIDARLKTITANGKPLLP